MFAAQNFVKQRNKTSSLSSSRDMSHDMSVPCRCHVPSCERNTATLQPSIVLLSKCFSHQSTSYRVLNSTVCLFQETGYRVLNHDMPMYFACTCRSVTVSV